MNVDSQNNAVRILSALRKSYAKRNLVDFTVYTNKRYKPNWHHFLIADRLEMLAKREIKRLCLNIPPRHGKSELVSVRFPAWYFGSNPNRSIIASSYNSKLAEEFGKKARNVVASIEFKEIFPEVKLSEESAAKLSWTIEENYLTRPCPTCGEINWSKKAFGRAICKTCHSLGDFPGSRTMGVYFGAGIGGGITGKGADILIIDDPHKGRKEAESEAMRKSVWDWFTSEAYPRLEESDSICICQTRWHQADLTGMLTSPTDNEIDNEWEVLSLPAIAEEDEEHEIFNPDYIEVLGTNILRRKKGEALWVTKYPLERLQRIKSTIHSFEFAAQYQQKPVPEGGGLFKRENIRYCSLNDGVYQLYYDTDKIKYYNESSCTRFSTCDLNIKDREDSDYTVIIVWDLTKDNELILRYMFRKKVDGAEHINLLWNIQHSYGPKEINIESVAYQATLVQTAVKQGLPAKEMKERGDKKTKALPAAALMESHKIFLLKSLPELYDIENELLQFPNGKHDDIVDNFGFAAVRATAITGVFYAQVTPDTTNKTNFNIANRKQFYNNLK